MHLKQKFFEILEQVKNLVLRPRETWEAIAAEETTVSGIAKNYLIYVAAIPTIASFLGNWIVGYQNPFVRTIRLSFGESLVAAIVQFILVVIAVWGAGMIVSLLAPTFGSSRDDVKGFKVAVYTATPLLTAGALFLIPSLSVLVFIIGLYGLYLLYIGLPIVMGTPNDKSLPYTVVIIVAVVLIFIVVTTITTAVLRVFGPSIL